MIVRGLATSTLHVVTLALTVSAGGCWDEDLPDPSSVTGASENDDAEPGPSGEDGGSTSTSGDDQASSGDDASDEDGTTESAETGWGSSSTSSDDESSGDATSGDASVGTDGSAGGDEGSTGDTTGDTGDDTGGEPDPDEPADGVSVIALYANQGVTTTLGEDGVVWSTAQHEANIVFGRTLMMRAAVDIDSDFVPRNIVGKLRIRHPDGSVTTRETIKFISADTSASNVSTSIMWELEPALVQSGLKFAVELYEHVPLGAPEGATAPRFPRSGWADGGIASSEQILRLVIVPYRHVYNGCDQTAPADPDMIDMYRREAMQQLPVQDVEIVVHAPVTYTASMGSLVDVLEHVTDLRAAEAPQADVFYFATVDPCDDTNAGGIGWVPSSPASAGSAPWRAAVGVYYSWAEDYTTSAMVHELGHNFGRRHVLCAGSEGTTDASYPHSGGLIASWGFGIEDRLWRPASTPETMSYCIDGEQWQSDYGWSWSLDILKVLGTYHTESTPKYTASLRVTRHTDGKITTQVVQAPVQHPILTNVRAVTPSGSTRLYGERIEISHDDAEVYLVSLSDADWRDLQAITWTRGAEVIDIAAHQIRGIERMRD